MIPLKNGKKSTAKDTPSTQKATAPVEVEPAELLNKEHLNEEQLLEKLAAARNQVIQSEKMAAIGNLAAGVAHEINNPVGFVASNLNTLFYYQKALFAIITQYRKLAGQIENEAGALENMQAAAARLGRIKKLQERFDLDYLCRDALALTQESIAGIARVKKIVLDLKAFVHPGREIPEPVDIHKLLESTLNLVWNKLKYTITVEKAFGDLPLVKCRPGQINQVFLNIIVNAIQAIDHKGTIRIATRLCDADRVEIAISDTGKGIAPENLPKIFTPFFTTKPVGEGSGIGLHMSADIIKKHHGVISVKSAVGQGSTFTIQLPINADISNE